MKTIKTSVTILEDLHWQLKEEAARRRLSDREAWEQSVRLWLGSDARLHALQEILNDPAHPMHSTLDRWTLMSRKMLAAGWQIINSANAASHVNVGRTVAKYMLTGGLRLMFGASRSDETITLTFRKN